MVGWGIMGYESEPLPSYPKLRNCSYSVKLITTIPRLFFWLVYRVLIPPAQHPACPRYPLRLRVYCIDGETGYPLRYGHLMPLDVHPDGVEPRGLHCPLYRWILPLSACPTFSVIPVIRCAARQCNAVRTLIFYPFTNQLSLPYSITNYTNALYIAPQARTVAPVLSRTLAVMPHLCRALRRFRYTAAQLLLL